MSVYICGPQKFFYQAGVAQLVEHNLAKVRVASSSLVSRSNPDLKGSGFFFLPARVVESVDTPDLKSCACTGVRVQVPPRVLSGSLHDPLFYLIPSSHVLLPSN